jgi:membrane protein DedA with SNARE-associated domain/rhodanese-related sulfurtransferase
METLISAIARNGYSILFTIVFLEAVGLPIPASIALIVAGGACATGSLQPGVTLIASLAGIILGDLLMYFFGRFTGWWLLGVLCRLSLNPEACILRSADAFYKRGRIVLVLAKFVPGINTMAPPLAGSMNMPFFQFLPLDFVGAFLYTFAFWGAGYIFSDFLSAMTKGYAAFSSALGWVIVILFAVYLLNRARIWFSARKLIPVRRVTVSEIAGKLAAVAIYDVRSHGYYEKNARRIRGSTRLEPHALAKETPKLPDDGREIVLYCTCVKEATSIRVARILASRGIETCVLVGGLRAWRKAGLPLEPVPPEEIVALPSFA